ncbi:MAG: citrate/2-methylcitrate synthase [Candidatus Saccharimonadales bacterium]
MSGQETQFNLREFNAKIVSLGSHPGIIQSMLDYAYCIGIERPNIVGIIGSGRKLERYFWGEKEITIKVYKSLVSLPSDIKEEINCVLNVQSARRVLSSISEAMEELPNLKIATIFAEQVPELHSIKIAELAKEKNIIIAGPASVGVLIPGVMKLGAIGGTRYPQLVKAGIFSPGNTAVVSTSGGMVNELIHTVTGNNRGVSFAIALGGDRYPITTPADAFLMAENDPDTKQIVYFGELGGDDEYVLADLIKQGKVTKRVIAYIAGTVAELFKEPPQFGHAKAMAQNHEETATAKKDALKGVGATVIDVFEDLGPEIVKNSEGNHMDNDHKPINDRHKSLILSHISGDVEGDVRVLNKDLLQLVEDNTLASLYISMLLGTQVSSQKLIDFTDYVLRLLVDHGPYVAGAVNTIISARAGKDLASSLTTGLLTIGPRFGGAINAGADAWLRGVTTKADPKDFVGTFASSGGIIPGIGHKKYRIDTPDPRVSILTEKFTNNTNGDRYLKFAKEIEAITTAKKGNLILNVDGTIAAIMLDIIESELGYTYDQLQELIDIEFFNAIFILGRSAGFISHYLDQRRNDEGLLRLSDEEISYIPE